MLKYIILTEAGGAELAFFCLAPATHVELALSQQAYRPARRIVSAGFVDFTYAGTGQAGCQLVARTYGRSESLALGPRTVDADFLTVFARATAEAAAASIEAFADDLPRP